MTILLSGQCPAPFRMPPPAPIQQIFTLMILTLASAESYRKSRIFQLTTFPVAKTQSMQRGEEGGGKHLITVKLQASVQVTVSCF